MSDDNSKLAPLLPISNRTVKRLSADDRVHTYVQVGHRQTPYKAKTPSRYGGGFCFYTIQIMMIYLNEVIACRRHVAVMANMRDEC